MAVAQIIGAVVGAVAGGIYGGVTAYESAKKKADSYKDAAKSVRSAAEKYSGDAAYNAMQQAGYDEANRTNRMYLGRQLNDSPANRTNKTANASALQGNYLQGYNLGASNKKTAMDAAYNYDTQKARNLMKQADIDYNVDNQTTQMKMNTAQGLANTWNDVRPSSDERVKQPINNDSGLPESDIEDSLRQIETIQYKYKDPSVPGCDGERHDSGFTAQSMEKTPMGKKMGIVKEGSDGVKRIDNWKLQEALMAGIAQLQREIDELEGKSNGNE